MTLENASSQFDSPDSLDKALNRAINDADASVHGHPCVLKLYARPKTWHIEPHERESVERAVDRECERRLCWKFHSEDYGHEYRPTNPPRAITVRCDGLDVPASICVQHEGTGGIGEINFERVGFVTVKGADLAIYEVSDE